MRREGYFIVDRKARTFSTGEFCKNMVFFLAELTDTYEVVD